MTRVIWKAIPGYDRQYEVSSTGLIRRISIKILKPEISRNGYLRVGIFKGNKQYQHLSIHRVVAQAFVLNPDKKPTVNHKNGVKSDNNSKNLEWATHSEQQFHAATLPTGRKGVRNGRAKLTESQVRNIRNMYKEGISAPKLAKFYEMDTSTIVDLIRYRTWKHIK